MGSNFYLIIPLVWLVLQSYSRKEEKLEWASPVKWKRDLMKSGWDLFMKLEKKAGLQGGGPIRY